MANEAISTLNDEINNKQKDYDSFYLVRCEWPTWLGDITTPQESLIQIEEIMSKYKPCFVRHNAWVDEVTNGN